MTKEEFRRAALELVYLSSCAVNGISPDKDRVSTFDLSALYFVAKKHMMASVAGSTLEKCGVCDERFKKAVSLAVTRNIQLDYFADIVTAELEKNGIKYMPLKGMILKHDYPDPGMREMSDNDVWIDPERRAEVRTIMENLGFRTRLYGSRADDNYIIDPGIVFEMHAALFGEMEETGVYGYYADVEHRLENDGGFRLRFTDVDFLTYLIAHEYKHFRIGGTGIRSLLDIYVYLHGSGKEVDPEKVYAELEKMGGPVADHGKKAVALALKLFSPGFDGTLSDGEKELFEYAVFSGVYGTVEHHVENRFAAEGEKAGKGSVLRRFLFISETDMKNNYPFFYKHKVMRPFLFFYRMGRAATVSRKKTAAVLRSVFKKKKR